MQNLNCLLHCQITPPPTLVLISTETGAPIPSTTSSRGKYLSRYIHSYRVSFHKRVPTESIGVKPIIPPMPLSSPTAKSKAVEDTTHHKVVQHGVRPRRRFNQNTSPPNRSGKTGPFSWASGWGPCTYPRCCLLYTSPSPRDRQKSRMPSSA